MGEEQIEVILREFGNRAQKEDIGFEELVEEYKEKYNVDIEVVTVELQNAFVYDYIVVDVGGRKYRINYSSDGFVMSIEEL